MVERDALLLQTSCSDIRCPSIFDHKTDLHGFTYEPKNPAEKHKYRVICLCQKHKLRMDRSKVNVVHKMSSLWTAQELAANDALQCVVSLLNADERQIVQIVFQDEKLPKHGFVEYTRTDGTSEWTLRGWQRAAGSHKVIEEQDYRLPT